jgi:hypothetical protein
MGVVYRVFDQTALEERALKRVRPEVAKDTTFVEALEREYRVLATLDHPRIIRVFDYGVDEAGAYYTMELLAGSDIRKCAPVAYREACAHLRDVATSLALLHARRLIHRDLSPGNVRLTDDGRCKLLDFGALAAFGTADVVAGTPPVVPPEALGHRPLDQRADLYSLGALAYWMLTGRHAYPARRLDELPVMWRSSVPAPPSAVVPGVPKELDQLVLALLSADPLARPASAAEVIARLGVIGELAPDSMTETRRLALSFLANPRFVGREAELENVDAITEAAVAGRGRAICLRAAAGMGRTRMLEEIGVRAQVAGAVVVRVDASTLLHAHGTAAALAVRLTEAMPERARKHARRFGAALRELGHGVWERIGVTSSAEGEGAEGSLAQWFAAMSLDKPLVVEVDNFECADDASLGLLVGLAAAAQEHPLCVVVTENTGAEVEPTLGLQAFRDRAVTIELPGLRPSELLDLARSLFGDAPGVERFTEWLNERTTGSPLHALEIVRQLFASGEIGYSAGVWSLPKALPDATVPGALHDALSVRLGQLSDSARVLAECLSLQRREPTFELCAGLVEGGEHAGLLGILGELADRGILYASHDGYSFSSSAIRDALVAGMDALGRERNHRKLGEALARLAGEDDLRARIEAGWHLVEGGDDLRGAHMIAQVTRDGVTVRALFANVHRIGKPIEAALRAYGKHHRSAFERLPLLAALAQAGYYEDRSWGERYGDEALYTLEELSGLATARRLRRFCGGWLALVLGITMAWWRFHAAPREDRPYKFAQIYIYLFGAVTTLAATASISFDSERTGAIADVLAPFAVLPERLTPVGILQFCRGMREITRENEAGAFEAFETLVQRFGDPRYYPTLPPDARKIYLAGALFVRGSYGIFRADGRGALESADALDRTGLKLYAMVASELRSLYYAFRGEFAKAAAHREQVELHAAHFGSLWQVETWEAAALMLIYPQIDDIVASTRLAHQLELITRTVPSMKLHAGLARSALLLSRGEPATLPHVVRLMAEYETHVPRSYAGWSGSRGYMARGFNRIGDHATAKDICERALAYVTEADREYVMHYLTVDLELAVADAALGQPSEAMARLDGLLRRYEHSSHRLALGLLHETRASIAWHAGQIKEYEESLAETKRCFLPTREPSLIAKCNRLEKLRASNVASLPPRAPGKVSDDGYVTPSEEQMARTVVSGRKSAV